MKLYNYWRSGTSYRVRIAFELKGLSYEYVPVDLREGAHKRANYLALNPQGLVPALDLADGNIISQSPAIIEFLEETYLENPLLPNGGVERAKVRALASIVGCDIHPLNNLRIMKYLKNDLEQPQAKVDAWIKRWIVDGFQALEAILKQDNSRGDFCHGGKPGLAECYLLPQIYSAQRFNVDMSTFKILTKIEQACLKLEAFERAYPDNQPDAD